MDTLSRSDTPTPAREPRTFELRDGEWAEAAPQRRLRISRWILVPAVLVALTGIVLIFFAAIAALATGGLVALRSTVVEQGARLRRRFARLFRTGTAVRPSRD
jgi:thiosulfate reductase cytochrome b subunit